MCSSTALLILILGCFFYFNCPKSEVNPPWYLTITVYVAGINTPFLNTTPATGATTSGGVLRNNINTLFEEDFT